MNKHEQFKTECEDEIARQGADASLKEATRTWMNCANAAKYSYHFEWMGRPIIQYPQDIVAMQEIIWRTQPDLIIETGIAHGGSLIFMASMLELNALCGGPANASILGIDIDIRSHNRSAIEAHPMARRIEMIEGSSISEEVIARVRETARGKKRVLVSLDSNHTHDHVLRELRAYAPLVTVGSYCVVFDTVIEDMPADMFPDRPWRVGDNPKTAVHAYLEETKAASTGSSDRECRFEVDGQVDAKLLITVAPGGFLKRVG